MAAVIDKKTTDKQLEDAVGKKSNFGKDATVRQV